MTATIGDAGAGFTVSITWDTLPDRSTAGALDSPLVFNNNTYPIPSGDLAGRTYQYGRGTGQTNSATGNGYWDGTDGSGLLDGSAGASSYMFFWENVGDFTGLGNLAYASGVDGATGTITVGAYTGPVGIYVDEDAGALHDDLGFFFLTTDSAAPVAGSLTITVPYAPGFSFGDYFTAGTYNTLTSDYSTSAPSYDAGPPVVDPPRTLTVGAPVPEPSVIAWVGFFGLALLRRRRK
jgi:hypothetical protein